MPNSALSVKVQKTYSPEDQRKIKAISRQQSGVCFNEEEEMFLQYMQDTKTKVVLHLKKEEAKDLRFQDLARALADLHKSGFVANFLVVEE